MNIDATLLLALTYPFGRHPTSQALLSLALTGVRVCEAQNLQLAANRKT
jgi:hypothetical protein